MKCERWAEMTHPSSVFIEESNKIVKQTWVSTLQEITDRGDIGQFIDMLTKISEGLGDIISNLGIFKTALIGVGTVIGSQKLG